MAAVSHIPFKTVNHTMAEDVADFHGGELVGKLGELRERLGLQFAQLWCFGDGPFTADEHAPGAVRVDAVMREGGPFESIFC